MVILASAQGIWFIFSNFFFFMAAVFGDILLIRICLIGGFLFLMINACVGLPDYHDFWKNSTPIIFIDIIVWCVITGAFHVYAVYLLIRDEAPVSLKDEEEEAVWRLFYRRSGMGRLEFREVIKRGYWRSYAAGETIVDETNALSHLHLIVEGVVEFTSVFHGIKSPPRKLYSGDLFNLAVTNLFGVKVGFNSDSFVAVAKSDCLVLCWSFDQVNVMANRIAPSVSSYWRNMILYTVASEFNRTHEGVAQLGCLDARGTPEAPYWYHGARTRDFEPLEEDEEPETTSCGGIMRWIIKSIDPFPPPGMRHNSLPASGILAKNRVEAVVKSLDQAHKDVHALGRGAAASIVRHQNHLQRHSRRPTPLQPLAEESESLGERPNSTMSTRFSSDDNNNNSSNNSNNNTDSTNHRANSDSNTNGTSNMNGNGLGRAGARKGSITATRVDVHSSDASP
ncbi:hypothetical protein PTSG_00482 [Salpingoeca rosetta]|uniref:Cyclic nucleotide-binding domain-containing protein n=1 Tax=Salpingoeca rosetta (strain ATCC 50818 / BSB-021) TaxID=946362 RepID=F2TWL3_SALR5|nr:uncharacterized protein PTSG_00482 [Salpingoeca rosetta]EGD72459.1 hypothetical protein PTSG_00482 [Salpingoeca rosetta]|eukprot:XP_004999028.1 hypothetical protein PTSG_00482 [Salpingoeca rosetta]